MSVSHIQCIHLRKTEITKAVVGTERTIGQRFRKNGAVYNFNSVIYVIDNTTMAVILHFCVVILMMCAVELL